MAGTFGEEVRRLRNAAGLSLDALASLTFYSKGHLSKIENGFAIPPLRQALKIDNALRAEGALVAALPGTIRNRAREELGEELLLTGLPPDSVHFLGRERELTECLAVLLEPSPPSSCAVVCAVNGMAGVGKTALVVRIAFLILDQFVDGCLFLDLHGHTGAIPPLSSAEALDRLLRRLGFAGEEIPPQLDERAALFRQSMAGKEMLLVLDNALDSQQIRPLLPANSQARVLVTSRKRLRALDDAHHLALDVLPVADATSLFDSVSAGAVPSEAERSTIVKSCGNLPLAVRIVAARCRDSLPNTINTLAARLVDGQRVLEEIEDGERSVTIAFAVSVETLPPDTQRVFSFLGLHPGTDWAVPAAAALADLEIADAERHLERLFNAHLLLGYSADRYRFHDLVGTYARRLAHRTLPDAERSGAVRRLLEWALDAVLRTDALIAPYRHRPEVRLDVRPSVVVEPLDYREALVWSSTEHANLVRLCRLASEEGFDALTWQLAYGLRDHFFLSKQWDDWILTHQLALDAAVRLSDVAAEAMTSNNLGLALMERGDLERSEPHFQQALELFESIGDEHGASNAIANYAWVLYYRKEYPAALEASERAYASYVRRGERRNSAIALRSIGLIKTELSRFCEATAHLNAALECFTDLGLLLDEAMALNCLGEACHRAGDLETAGRWLFRAVERSRECGSSYEEARAHRMLGQIAADRGDQRRAAYHWEHALSRYARLRAPQTRHVRGSLDPVRPVDGTSAEPA